MNAAKILIGVTGSIAAYKSADLVSQLIKLGHQVKVVMSENATQFITPLTLETLSRHPVHIQQFNTGSGTTTEHIALARWADLVCVAPASADFICKYAAGIADNLLLTELLAFEGPVLLAPAMNHSMYLSTAVQTALQSAVNLGAEFIDPYAGELACGEYGTGKMALVETIVEKIQLHLHHSQLLKGKKIVITAGPTRAYIDPARFISNPSSGKMGFALAKAATSMGAEVVLISGPTDSRLNFKNLIRVETTEQMLHAVQRELNDGNGSKAKIDLFIGAAAVNDFSTVNVQTKKSSKPAGSFSIEMKPEIDIISQVSNSPHRPKMVVGFAAETHDHLQNASNKLKKKNLDYIIVNDVADQNIGFATDVNQVTIIGKNNMTIDLPRLRKEPLAIKILEWLIENSDANYRQHNNLSATTAGL